MRYCDAQSRGISLCPRDFNASYDHLFRSDTQMDRESPITLIDGLTTTADKIRALGRAGYRRTEISEILNISYQHVRNVLLRSGITNGLSNQSELERPAISVAVSSIAAPQHQRGMLLDAGFRLLGEWVCRADGELELNTTAPGMPGVYAIIVNEVVMYVGLAQRGFRSRMGHYRRGHQRQRTSARIKACISECLAAGKQVKGRRACEPNSSPHCSRLLAIDSANSNHGPGSQSPFAAREG